MNKMAVKFLITVILSCYIGTAIAVPMLSSDGSLLSGVDVDGVFYNVSFADGTLADIYPTSALAVSGWAELVFDIHAGIAHAFRSLPVTPAPSDINGCDGTTFCEIFLPDSVSGSDYLDLGPVAVFDTGIFWSPGVLDFRAGDYDSSTDGGLTYAQFSRAVPAPSNIVLLLLGLGLLSPGRIPIRFTAKK